jgi:hypothetical protein
MKLVMSVTLVRVVLVHPALGRLERSKAELKASLAWPALHPMQTASLFPLVT